MIVIEGGDGTGKGTQMELLEKEFRDAVFLKYPTRNFPMLNDYLEKKIELDPKSLFLLFLADIADEQEKIRIAQEEGKAVFLDRYIFSTIAYELDKISYEQAKQVVEAMDLIRPDKVFLLDITPEESQERKRAQKSLDRYESDIEYLGKVRNNFLRLYEDRFLCDDWVKIDASKSIEEVHEEIRKALG